MSSKPTIEFYSYLNEVFDFFNERLFDGELSPIMFVVTRKKNVAGHFRKRGWINEVEDCFHEIAVNPQHFISASPLELYQTIAHEQVHQWQSEHGTESRGGYHNTEWAEKMRSIGLEPISSNGKGTGQAVSDEPIPGGLFEQACIKLFLRGHKLSLVDGAYNTSAMLRHLNSTLSQRVNEEIARKEKEAFSQEEIKSIDFEMSSEDREVFISTISAPINEFYNVEVPMAEAAKTSYSKKSTYQCGGCGIKAWGAPTIKIGCKTCNKDMNMVV